MTKTKHTPKPKPITNWDEVPVLFDIAMAARLLGGSPDWISRRCQRGELPAYKEGEHWRFEKKRFIDYIDRQYAASRTQARA